MEIPPLPIFFQFNISSVLVTVLRRIRSVTKMACFNESNPAIPTSQTKMHSSTPFQLLFKKFCDQTALALKHFLKKHLRLADSLQNLTIYRRSWPSHKPMEFSKKQNKNLQCLGFKWKAKWSKTTLSFQLPKCKKCKMLRKV